MRCRCGFQPSFFYRFPLPRSRGKWPSGMRISRRHKETLSILNKTTLPLAEQLWLLRNIGTQEDERGAMRTSHNLQFNVQHVSCGIVILYTSFFLHTKKGTNKASEIKCKCKFTKKCNRIKCRLEDIFAHVVSSRHTQSGRLRQRNLLFPVLLMLREILLLIFRSRINYQWLCHRNAETWTVTA